MNLLDKVYLPQLEKDQIRNSESYKLLKDNNLDPTVLEGYESNYKDANIQIKDFDTFINEGGTKEDWIAQHVTPENKKAFFGTIGDFIVETGKDTLLSLGVAGINGADVAVNMMPLVAKVLDNSPLATALPNGFMNAETEADVYNAAKYASENLDKAREYLKSFKEDDNVVSQLIGIMGQDLVYSIPIYNKLKSLGVPNYPAFFISGGIGGAIGVEEKIFGEDSYFSKNLFAKDIAELKNLIGILPNTPEDKIADEVVQALEYGSFSVAIPGIIDAFKFMKRYIPAFSATAGVGVGMTADNEAEGSPIKAITNAVKNVPIFKSAVLDAAEKKITAGSAEQIFNTIKNTPGVKATELKWLDLENQLKNYSQLTKKPLTQENVLELIRGNQIDIIEKTFGGAANRLSDDLEQKILNFEQKVEKAARAQDLGYADINYDVYPYAVRTARNNRIDEVRKETSMSFSQLDDMLLGLPINSKTFLDDFTTKSGQIEIHKFTDNLNNRPVYVGRELAEELINEKEIVRDIPAALNTPGTPRYTRLRVLEFEPLEIEKFLIEREKRLFMRENNAPKFETYTEPGGDDYTELVFKVKRGGLDVGIPTTRYDDQIRYTPYKNPSHMNVKSEIAHVRFKTRINGNMKILAVEEMQSDFGIRTAKIKQSDIEQIDEMSGSQLGLMAEEAFPGNKFTVAEATKKLKANVEAYDFPFKNNWYELTIKRLVRYAADNGFDAISIPKGDLAANRYGQSISKAKKINIQASRRGSKEILFNLAYTNEAGNIVKGTGVKRFDTTNYEEIEKLIGKKEYKKIEKDLQDIAKGNVIPEGDFSNIDFDIKFDKDIIVGSGSGKYRLYNETIPSYMKKYAKKWNAKVYDDTFDITNYDVPENEVIEKGMPVTVLEVTPEMKQSVQSTSQPLFEIFGTVGLSTWGAKAVQDSIENNIISQNTN